MKKTYSKKINDWELDIEYIYIPAEEATHDYPGTGSTVEVGAVYLWNDTINVLTDEQVDMSEFFYELCPNVMYEIEKEITEEHEDS
tara:strand:- start:2661 stop:2918 length:258 start_codon:yes stop_codon:yes gene_type:complete